MMKSRKLGIGLLLLLAVVVTTGTFAYWTSGLAADSAVNADVTVSIGSADATSSTVTLTAFTANTGSALIPSGQGNDGTDDTATWTIPIEWAEDTTSDFSGATGDLTYTIVYAMTGFTDTELKVLFSDSIDVTTITEGAAAADVVITVVFDTEPTDQTEYDLIESGTLTITITWTVTPQ